MPIELLVVLAAGLVVLQMAFVVLRRTFHDERSYLLLLGADLAALAAVHALGQEHTFYAWFAVAMAAVLTLAPRFLERREAVAVESGDLEAARRWAFLRGLVVPGRGTTLRRRQVDDLIEVRTHGSQAVTRRLREQLARAAGVDEAESLHEELVAMLLVDRRFAEATEHFERHLGPTFLLRRPGLLPQLVHAYGELGSPGNLSSAAALVALGESGPVGRDPSLFPLMQRTRLLFIAYAGADRTLAALLESPAGMVIGPAEREHLTRVARARALSAPPASSEVDAVVRLAAARAGESVRLRIRRPTPATYILIGLNLAAFVASGLVPGDEGVALARAGALFGPAVLAGEWWRAVTAMFLHGFALHLGINMYGLYLLGRFVEDLCGSLRFVVIYFLAGLAGAAATTLVGQQALSVGASGALMGLLGAMIVVLVLRRRSFAAEWRRMLLWNLVLLVGLQIGIGFVSTNIDNAAHMGGLVGGALAAVLFAPGLVVGTGAFGRAIVRVTAAACAAVSLLALVAVVRTPLPTTLARLPVRPLVVDGVSLTVPRYWELDAQKNVLVDSYLGVELTVARQGAEVRVESPQWGDPAFTALLERIRASARPAP